MRIAIVGTSGSGKSTLARAAAARLGVPHIELDALHWEPNWTEAPDAVMRGRVDAATAGGAWVADGNYRKVADLVLGRADTLVWLDFPLPHVLWQLWWRTLRRWLTGEELWNGNRERLWPQLASRESLFLWAIKTHGSNRKRYSALVRHGDYAPLDVIRLRSPRAARAWLARLSSETWAGPRRAGP